jgi:hypothetical protein
MKTLFALIAVARCACSLMECSYSIQAVPVEYQFGSSL